MRERQRDESKKIEGRAKHNKEDKNVSDEIKTDKKKSSL